MKILFKIYPQKSHINATFPLARTLRERGHEVIYAGIAPLQAHVAAQGFTYHVQTNDIFPWAEQKSSGPKLTFWSIFSIWWRNRQSSRTGRRRFLVTMDPFSPLIRTIMPDLILIDSPYTFFALSLFRTGVPFAITESMMNLDRGPDCPPLDSTCIPTGKPLSRLLIRLHWHRYFIKRALISIFASRADFNRRFVRQRARTMGANPSRINFNRYFHLGLLEAPEVILSPRLLDFPRQPAPHQIYAGPSVDLNRQESMSDFSFSRRFAEFVSSRTRGSPLVYCSLGTGAWRYRGAEQFLQHLLDATRGADWNLVLAVGTEFDPAHLRAPPNAMVFQFVPQLQVLRSADLMITHGGMNSVGECAFCGVPMLVYPGTKQIDQAGNAARIVYHQLGLMGNLASESSRGLRLNIERILHSSEFKARADLMAVRLRESTDLNLAIDRLLCAVAAPKPHSATVAEV
jgi:zeaxanthin glucosyltransferase